MQEVKDLIIKETVEKTGKKILTLKKTPREISKNKVEILRQPLMQSLIIPKREEVGRPTVMTEIIISKLDEAFAMDCTFREACLFAGISYISLYRYCEQNPEYRNRIEQLKDNPILLARRNVVNSLRAGNVENSQWYLTKKAKREFGEDNTILGGTVIQQVEKITETELTTTTVKSKTLAYLEQKHNGNI